MNEETCSCYYGASNDDECSTDHRRCPCCIGCLEMTYCSIFDQLPNQIRVEDKYYPDVPGTPGSCYNIDERAARLVGDEATNLRLERLGEGQSQLFAVEGQGIFGPDKTFRNNADCRTLVLAYICLWWAARSDAYDNRCSISGDPVRPCRSFCVQVGMVCANNVEWLKTCENVRCPPKDGTCSPGEVVTGIGDVVSTDDACRFPDYSLEYSAGSSAMPSRALHVLAAAVAALGLRRLGG